MSDIYHEKQSLQFCAVHALNNLFQYGKFCSKEKLDEVCLELNASSIWNPHRSALRIGNYDINVIILFLQKLDFNVIWFDKRKPTTCINTEVIKGFLVNTISPVNVLGLKVNIRHFKHWYAVTKVNNIYYNLDSKLKEPAELGNDGAVKEYLQSLLAKNDCEILIITSNSVSKEQVYQGEVT